MPVSVGGFSIEFDLEDDNVIQNLKYLTERVGPQLEQFMQDDLAEYLRNRAQSRFANEGDDAVGAWAPLKPATETRRSAKGYSPAHPINVRSGDLKSYITGNNGTVTGGLADWLLTWPDAPPSGELDEKTRTAQMGKIFPSTVARPVIGLGQTDVRDIEDALEKFITEGLI